MVKPAAPARAGFWLEVAADIGAAGLFQLVRLDFIDTTYYIPKGQ